MSAYHSFFLLHALHLSSTTVGVICSRHWLKEENKGYGTVYNLSIYTVLITAVSVLPNVFCHAGVPTAQSVLTDGSLLKAQTQPISLSKELDYFFRPTVYPGNISTAGFGHGSGSDAFLSSINRMIHLLTAPISASPEPTLIIVGMMLNLPA